MPMCSDRQVVDAGIKTDYSKYMIISWQDLSFALLWFRFFAYQDITVLKACFNNLPFCRKKSHDFIINGNTDDLAACGSGNIITRWFMASSLWNHSSKHIFAALLTKLLPKCSITYAWAVTGQQIVMLELRGRYTYKPICLFGRE